MAACITPYSLPLYRLILGARQNVNTKAQDRGTRKPEQMATLPIDLEVHRARQHGESRAPVGRGNVEVPACRSLSP